MNRILLTVTVIVFTAFTSFAGKNEMSIKGTITNPLADSVTFSYYGFGDNWLDFKSEVVSKKLDEEGNFLVTLSLPHHYTQVYIQNGEQATEIFASPGDKLVMSVDAANFDETVKYEGVGMKAAVANFMAKHMLQFGFTRNFHDKVNKILKKEPDSFKKALSGIVQKEYDFLIDNSEGLPQSFIKFWNAEYEYSKYNKILEYPMMHEVAKQNSYSVKIPRENYEIVKSVPARFNDDHMNLMSYRSYISSYYNAQLSAEGVEDTIGTGTYRKADKMLELAHQHMPKASEEYVYANYLYGMVKYLPMERIDYCYSVFTSRYPESAYTKTLDAIIAVKKKLSIGSPAIDFTVKDADGKKVKISDLKGKVVYIDFWASWCGPCKAQFSHVKKIKEHFAGKDVVFVYVSIDEDEDAWKKAIEKYHLTGLHMLDNGGWKGEIATEYGIRSVPSYFLVDKEGNFATNVGDTPRPSSGEELIKKIESLL